MCYTLWYVENEQFPFIIKFAIWKRVWCYHICYNSLFSFGRQFCTFAWVLSLLGKYFHYYYRLLDSLVVKCWLRVREVPGSIPSQGPRHTKDGLKMERGWKKRMTTQNRHKSNDKKITFKKKTTMLTVFK